MNRPPHILLVDDDRLVLATMAKGLRDAQYHITTASSGQQAIELASDHEFDLAVLDIRMPGISGIETARQLFQYHSLPSIFLSAYDEGSTVADAVQSGGFGYVVKPIDAPQLVPTLEAALARARDMRALVGSREQLEKALSSGRYTSMAVGIMMERGRLSQKEAFEQLRHQARSGNRKLEQLCEELVLSLENINLVCAGIKK